MSRALFKRLKILLEALARKLVMHPYSHELFCLADASVHSETMDHGSCTALLTCSAVSKYQLAVQKILAQHSTLSFTCNINLLRLRLHGTGQISNQLKLCAIS